MFSASKVTENYCMADDFRKEFACGQEKICSKIKGQASYQVQSYERYRDYGCPSLVSFGRFQRFQTLL